MANVIPSMVDGLKECERLALYWALEDYDDGDPVDVRLLAMTTNCSTQGYGVEHRDEAIFRLAQKIVGTNNINLFEPVGHFGDRYEGPLHIGATPTGLGIIVNPIASLIFNDSLVKEGCSSCDKHPHCLLPIIPFILVNGCDGRGTWLHSYIPKYKLQDIISNVRLCMAGKDMFPMKPWFRGFKGRVQLSVMNNSDYVIYGAIAEIDYAKMIVTITELPVGLWTSKYMTWLHDQPWVKSVRNMSESTETIHLKVTLSSDVWLPDEEHLMKTLKLVRTISISDMYALDPCGDVVKYESPLEIIRAFVDYRVTLFNKRKVAELADMMSKMSCISFNIKHTIAVAVDFCSLLDRQVAVLNVETVNLSDLLRSLNENTEDLKYVYQMKRELENEIRRIFLVTKRVCGKDDIDKVQEGVATTLQTITNAVSEVVELCRKKDVLKFQHDQLERRDACSLWLNDLDKLERYVATSMNHEK